MSIKIPEYQKSKKVITAFALTTSIALFLNETKKVLINAEEIEINPHNKRYDLELKPLHPGEILKTEFLEPLKMSEVELAKNIQVKKSVIKDLVAEKRIMTVDLAYRLYFYFGVSAEYWLNFQKNYDLATYQELAEKQIRKQIQPYPRAENHL
ncbi:12185_t:CDS:2 [Entrophospora sp. SA101]|nr:12185_t:CDS:2 [Entrophospora sp. SA101]CAJ0841929.1 10682_t:CDS:2 [Entrophospora sp. SA101]